MAGDCDWVKLVDPTPEEVAIHGTGCWSECRRCGGRTGIALPADLGDVLEAMRVVLDAHRGCLPSDAERAAVDRQVDEIVAVMLGEVR